MTADFVVDSIYTDEEIGEIFAKCHDNVYGEEFEKYLGIPDEWDGKQNASTLLQDSMYEMTDELRAEISDIFGVEEFEEEENYSFDFSDDEDIDFEEDEYVKEESFNLREALNKIDIDTYNKYDLLNLYESCNLSENEKRVLANIVYDKNDPSVIYDTLNDRFVI